MAKRKKSLEKCYMCEDAGITKEHVPPYSFFPEGHRDNLITVSSCQKHNNHLAKDVEYVRNIIATSIQVNEVGSLLTDKVIRSYTKSPGLAKLVSGNMRTFKVGNEKTGIFSVDLDRFNSVVQSIAYALYFRDFGSTYPNDWVIYPISMESEQTIKELSQSQHGNLRMAMSRLETVDRHTNQPEVFKYAVSQENQQVIYKLVFYGHFVVYAVG